MSALVQAIAVKAEPPSLQDNTGDLDRLKQSLASRCGGREPLTPLSRLAAVAGAFRNAGFRGAAIINNLPGGPELVDFLPALPKVLPAMALDLGTTHLEATLLDLLSGQALARATFQNRQVAHGADILARIHYASAKTDGAGNFGLETLHQSIIGDINALAVELAGRSGLAPAMIRALYVAGNTTMIHFLLEVDPYHLCREPYIPVVNAPDPCRAAELNLVLHPVAPVMIMPSVGSYFGGDLISGIVATGIDLQDETCMLIDVGTNAEVVLGNRDWLIACAGAAGPALEGGVTKMGMQAGPGAIDTLTIDQRTGTLAYTTLDNQPPRGICGSGIIDLVAAMYLARVIDLRGRFRTDPGNDSLRRRLVQLPDGPGFVIAGADETADGKPVVVSQIDLDALIRSKAAMYSILTTLVNQVDVQFGQLHRIYVAGAFGKHIQPRQAIILGMLPDLPLAVYEPVGNSSLAGVEKALCHSDVRQRSLQVADRITYLELNVNQEFMIRFSGCRFIPHTDRDLFPSVPSFREE